MCSYLTPSPRTRNTYIYAELCVDYHHIVRQPPKSPWGPTQKPVLFFKWQRTVLRCGDKIGINGSLLSDVLKCMSCLWISSSPSIDSSSSPTLSILGLGVSPWCRIGPWTHIWGFAFFSLNNDVIDFRFWQGFAQSWIKSSCGYMKDNVCEVLVEKLLLLLSVRWQIWSNNFGDCNQYRETEIAHGLLCQIILWLCAISQSIHVLLEIHWMSDQTWYLDTGQQRMFLITAVLKLNGRVLEATNSKNGTLVSVVR